MADGAIKVAVRVRPPFPEEQAQCEEGIIEVVPESAQLIVASEHGFSFDYAFDTSTTQEDLYACCVSDLIGKITTGYNCCVLMYGQTGSGKTYTMGTNYGQSQVAAANPGIIPRALRDLFSCLSQQQEGHWTVRVSFLEIYNESVFDLLAGPKDREAIPIREVGKVIVLPGLVQREVGSPEEALHCLEQGSRNRSTGATLLNSCSSRSHAIFSVHLQGQVEGTMFTSKLQLVDLAGSEAVKRTHSTGDRKKEGVSINLGLLALGNVINSLCSGKAQFISYRDSSLTRILRDSLNGSSFTVMIACISPAICNVTETVSTLRYADRARQIRTKPTFNRLHKVGTPYRRNLDMPPPQPTPSCRWQAGHQTSVCRTLVPSKSVCNSSLRRRPGASALQLESTLLGPAPEEDAASMAASDAASFMTAESLSPVAKHAALPLTPLVERLCERLEPTLRDDIGKKLESFMAQSYLGNATAVTGEPGLTDEQQTLVDMLDTTLQQQKRRTMGRSPLQDATNAPDTVKRKKLSNSNSGSEKRRSSWQSSPNLRQRSDCARKSTDAENETVICAGLQGTARDNTPKKLSEADGHASPVTTQGGRKQLQRLTTFVAPKTPTSCIATRTRRRTTVFHQAPIIEMTPVARTLRKAMRGRRSCATCRVADRKHQAQLSQETPGRAQLTHNKNVLKLLNTAPEKDLRLLAKVGPKKARMLYLHRTLRGNFENFEDLKKVEGLGGTAFFQAFMSANILTKQ
ncbi:uncharacterized protein LOC144120661 isoform X1 [Amblyomma americanum]